MAKKISNQDLFENDFGKPLIDVFKDIQKEIDESIKGIRKFGSALKDEVKANKLETAEDVQKLSEARKKANKAIETESELQKQRVKILEQLKQAQTEEYKENERLRAELNRQKKEVRETFKEEEKLNRERKAAKGSIVQMRLELSRLTKAYDNLTKEERENAKVGGVLLKQIQRQRQAVGDLERATGRAQRNVGNYADAWGRVGSLFSRGLGFLGITAGIAGIKSFIDSSIDAFRIQEKAVAQVKAGIESTAGAAGLSLQELKKEAAEFERTTLFGDEEVLKNVTAQLLTFTNITGDAFKRTQAATLDLATRMDGDLKGAALQLGKALNDPVANLSALSRSGIQFSKEQKELIKSLVETNRLSDAQTIILDELNNQFGGSALAAAEADGGFTQLANTFGSVKEIIGQVIVEGLKPLIMDLKDFFATIDIDDVRSFFSALKTGVKVVAVGASAWIGYKTAIIASNVATKAYTLATTAARVASISMTYGIRGAKKAFQALNVTMKANPIGLVVSAITALISAFSFFGDEVEEETEKVEDLNKALDETKRRMLTLDEIIGQVKFGQLDIDTTPLSDLEAALSQAEQNLKDFNPDEVAILFVPGEDAVQTAKRQEAAIKTAREERLNDVLKLRELVAKKEKAIQDELNKKETKRLGLLEELREKVKNLREEQNKSRDPEIIKEKQKEIDLTQKQIDNLTRLEKKKKKDKTEINALQSEEKRNALAMLKIEKDLIDQNVDADKIQREIAEQRIKDLETEILLIGDVADAQEIKAEKELEIAKLKKQIADQDAKNAEDEAKRIREKNREMLQIAQEFYAEQGRARREQIDREIADSKRREDQLTQLAAGGSEEAQRSLALEQQRQSQLEQERRKSLRRQRQLAFGLAGAELIISNARQGSSDPAGKSLEQLANFSNGVADIFKNLPAFETGGKVKGGEQIVRINEKGEEFVVKHSAVEKYGDKMLNDINNGTFDAFNYVQTPSGVVHQSFSTDFSELKKEFESLRTEIKNKPVPYIAISEVTGGLKKTIQEGNKFTTQHFRKSNLF